MLEQVKMEFNQLTEESIACQRQRDEYQHKCEQHWTLHPLSVLRPGVSVPHARPSRDGVESVK